MTIPVWRSRLLTVGLLGLLATTGLTACENSAQPKEIPSTKETAHPSLSPEQAANLITQVNQSLADADQAHDIKAAKQRIGGPAAEMRTAEYLLQSKDKKYSPIAFAKQSKAVAVTSSTGWPRAIFNITDGKATDPIYVMVIKQSTSQDPFQLWQWMQILPGKQLPSTNAALKGSLVISADSPRGLVTTPEKAVLAWGNKVLDPNAKTDFAIDSDPLTQTLQQEKQKLESTLKNLGTLTTTINLDKNSLLAVKLPDGGALVSGTYRYHLNLKNVKPAAPVQFSGELAALLGQKGKIREQADWEYLVNVLLEIPTSPLPDSAIPNSHTSSNKTDKQKKSEDSNKKDKSNKQSQNNRKITAVAGSRVLVKATGK